MFEFCHGELESVVENQQLQVRDRKRNQIVIRWCQNQIYLWNNHRSIIIVLTSARGFFSSQCVPQVFLGLLLLDCVIIYFADHWNDQKNVLKPSKPATNGSNWTLLHHELRSIFRYYLIRWKLYSENSSFLRQIEQVDRNLKVDESHCLRTFI